MLLRNLFYLIINFVKIFTFFSKTEIYNAHDVKGFFGQFVKTTFFCLKFFYFGFFYFDKYLVLFIFSRKKKFQTFQLEENSWKKNNFPD